MSYGAIAGFVGATENAASGDGGPAFRCGPYLPKGEGPIRGAVSRPASSAASGQRVVIGVNWAPDVAWRKRIRPFGHLTICSGDIS